MVREQLIELLAPAKDLECGVAAIDCGADAVYIGPARFGAREAAGNSVEDIARLAEYGHKYWAKVYATINTLLNDDELPAAVELAWRLHEAGVDGLIVQDTGLLESGLPPLPLIASTQMNNATPAKVAFLEAVGFRRAILARELSLEQIREIRAAAPGIELECFVLGSLCVGYSGQCYMSFGLGGRSGNRGACAQPCRKKYDLVDAQGNKVVEGKHLLSLKDLDVSAHLGELLAAGVTAFKIEGRLKDAAYVANATAHVRRRLDEAIESFNSDQAFNSKNERGPGGTTHGQPHLSRWGPGAQAIPSPVGTTQNILRKCSSGMSHIGFTPDVTKTFNRGFTSYFLKRGMRNAGIEQEHAEGLMRSAGFQPAIQSRQDACATLGSMQTPKMVGEALGAVKAVGKKEITIETTAALHAGDGLCWFGRDGQLRGSTVNAARGPIVELGDREALAELARGTIVYRNHDHEFLMGIKKASNQRRVGVTLTLSVGAKTRSVSNFSSKHSSPYVKRAEAGREAALKRAQAEGEGDAQPTASKAGARESTLKRADSEEEKKTEGLSSSILLRLEAEDEDGVRAGVERAWAGEFAEKPERAIENIEKQLAKTGGTIFECARASVEIGRERVPFLPVAEINALRREALEMLTAARERRRERPQARLIPNDAPYPERELSYLGNVLNRRAKAFYQRHGVVRIEPAAEAGSKMRGRKIMTTRYCLLRELGMCRKEKRAEARTPNEPLTLVDEEGNRLRLSFRCERCEMEIYLQ